MTTLTKEQQALTDYMSELSEEAYHAGWMMGLEFALWDAMNGVHDSYGMITITDEHRAKLRELSNACGGWIVWDDESDETWISSARWEAKFAEVTP